MTRHRYRYFKENELTCPCCGKSGMNHEFMQRIEDARRIAGIPFVVNSAFRCVEHNLNPNVGGSERSSHLTGNAMDIKITSDQDRFTILFALIEAGFDRIGIGANFIHVDDDLGKNPGRVWVY